MGLLLSRRSFLATCAALPALRAAERQSAEAYAERRRRLADAVGSGVIALLGYESDEGQSGFTGFRQESNFYYLTGHDEPGAALLIAPRRGDDAYREVLFLPTRSDAAAKWSGPSIGIDGAERLGFQDVRDAASLRKELRALLRDRKKLAGLRPRAAPSSAGSRSRAAMERLEETGDAKVARDVRGPLALMRAVKSPGEIALLRDAVNATETGFRTAWRAVADGATERSVAAEFVAAAFRAGCERLAFPPMAASGPNATILHYQRNGSIMQDGQLLLLDAGAEYSRYASDIARTVPVSGKFTERQRLLYELVVRAQRAAIAAAKPGARLIGSEPRTLESIAERVMREGAPRGVDTYLPHALGHHVGLDVHDPAPPSGVLKEGMVLAIEPGIYLPREAVGIRVEDMVEITPDGCRLMSAGLPSSVDELENALSDSHDA